MNTNLNLVRIGKCLDAYDLQEGNEQSQNGLAFAMLKEVYPEEEDFDNAKRRFFATEGKTTQDVYGYFRKLYDDAKNPSPESDYLANNPQNLSAEQSNEIIKSDSWLKFQNFSKRVSPEIRNTAFSIVYAEGTRTDIAEAWADKLLSMPEDDRNAVLWGAYVLSPEKSSNFFGRVGTRVMENLSDNAFNIDNYLEASQKGVNPHTIFDVVSKLDAIDEYGKVRADKLEALNKRLNELRSENSIFNEESSTVYAEKIRNAVRHNSWRADKQVYDADFIEKEYAKGKKYKEVFNLVSQIRDIKRSYFGKQGAVSQTIEDATVVGVEMLKYVGASALGSFISKNPIASISLVSAVMYSEFKPQMFNALRNEGNMSVEDANKYANFATTAMIGANYVGYTTWIKTIKPSSYLLGTEISKANAREYLFHAIKEMPKNFIYQGGTETISEYAEALVEYATKSWATDHADATFDETQLWENFCQDFKDTTRIMPTLMLGSTLIGGGLAINNVRRNSGAGWNFRKLISPSDAINHTVQTNAAYAQADVAAKEAAKKLGGTEQSIDFVQKYKDAKTDEEKSQLFNDTFSSEEERENARAILENVDKFDAEIHKALANVFADAAKENARETEELNRKTQNLGILDNVQEDSDGVKKFTVIENLLDKLGARNEVVMINTAEDLEALGFSPQKAQEIFSQVGRKGMYSAENDKVYMLPSHFKDGVDAFRTFAHERGHWIMEKLKNSPEYRGMISTVIQLTGGEENLRSLLPTSYANENVNNLAEEYLMRVVERVAMEDILNANQKGVWNFFKSKFKKWFGGDNTFANMADKQIAEIARDIYRRSVGEKQVLGNYWEASTPENNAKKVSGVWEVVDVSELITSTDKGYDDTLQPRNRSRQGSTVQTSEIATFLDTTRLDGSATTDEGAPIIDARKMVISGNGRTLAIRKAYGSENKERARDYREFVLRRAEELGIDVDANIKTPELVRRVDNLGDMTLADFAARSNKSQIAAMSNAENAIADARRILDAHLLDIFFPSESGDVLAASNNDFITSFLDLIGNREEYIDKHGARKPNLAPRIKSAVLAATLNPEKRDIIEDLLDNPQGWSGLINGLLGSVANIAKLDGNADYDLSKELSEAVEIYVGLQRTGETVARFNAQEDFLRPKISEEVGFLIELFEKNSRTPTGISGVLNEYYNLVKNIDTTSQDMFGADNPPKIDQLRGAYKKYATDLTQEASPSVQWRDTGSYSFDGFDDKDPEFLRQVEEVKAKWTNPDGTMKKGYHRAPNGKPSKLTEAQWLAVRTPNFKRWFGDWETLAIINEIEKLPALELKKATSDYSTATKVKALFDSFGVAENSRNGQSVIFAKGSVGKIIGHKSDVPISEVLDSFKDLFESSVLAIEEKEVLKEGHKEHTNFKGYEHYVNKFNYNGKPYYIRFTVQVENAKPQTIKKGYVPRKVHSSMITDVSIYKENSQSNTDLSTSGTKGVPIFDNKLADFLNSVNEKGVSKVIDENGEPLVVYHGTKRPIDFDKFFVFDKNLSKTQDAIFFTDSQNLADDFTYIFKDERSEYVGDLYSVFLNIKNPIILDLKGVSYFGKGEEQIEEAIVQANKNGNDGIILRNIKDRNTSLTAEIESNQFLAFNSNQIKSATDNIGTYSDSPDIRWREVETRSPEELDAINKQHADLYVQYKNGKVELTASERNEWAKNLYGERGDLIKFADYPNKIYDIDEAYDFVRKNIQGETFRSKDNHTATLGRGGVDKMNSGLARKKTNNDKLHAYTFANVGRVFSNSIQLATEVDKNNNPNIKAVHKFYAPIYFEGQLYAVKITAKELSDGTGNRLYSIEGIDVNSESEYRGQSRGSKENSIPADYSDSVNNFIGKLQEVNKKIDSDAREYSKTQAYEKAVQLVAEEAKRKGYDVKVYHGTGADGFNVALADSSKAKYGEGAQAHGKGLYMAVSRDTAENYKKVVNKEEKFLIGDKDFSEYGIIDEASGITKELISQVIKDISLLELDATKERYSEIAGKYLSHYKALKKNEKQFIEFLRTAKLSKSKIILLDEPFSKQSALVKKAIRKMFTDAGKNFSEIMRSGYVNGDAYGNELLGEITVELCDNDFEKLLKLLLNYDIIGTKHDTTEADFIFDYGKDISYFSNIQDYQSEITRYSQRYNRDRDKLKVIDRISEILKENELTSDDVIYKKSNGKLFDWFHNMKPSELLDEDRRISLQNDEVIEKLRKIYKYEINPRHFDALYSDMFDDGNLDRISLRHLISLWSDILGKNKLYKTFLKYGIRGITYDGRQDGRCFVSFEGGATVKLQDPFTFDDKGKLIPLTERFNDQNPDMRWRIADEEALNKIQNLSDADIKAIIDEAEKSVSQAYTESKERNASKLEADKAQYVKDGMSKWEDEDEGYYNNPDAYSIYKEDDDRYVIESDKGTELDWWRDLENAKKDALERFWEDKEYDEFDYKDSAYEDDTQDSMRKKFEYALEKIGIEITESTGGTYWGSQYLYLKLPNGDEKKIRFADHAQKYSADMSVEEDWQEAFRFFVERVQKQDWTEENYPDDIRWKIDGDISEEKRAVDEWANNPENVENLADEYLSNSEFKQNGQIIVDPDEIRALLPNYEVSTNSDFVEAGDKVLEVVWAKALKLAPKDKPVVLLTGNPAAGKGTAKKDGLLEWVTEANLVFDAPQNKFSSVEKRVREAIEAGHTVQIIQIYNDPITSWENSIKRGIAKGRFLPMDYFIDVYRKNQGKVGRIENELRKKYGEKLKTKYIDSRENNPIVVIPSEASAWVYSISESQLEEIERITNEYRERVEESARLRGDKKNPLALIGRRLSKGLELPIRGFTEGVSGRDEQGSSRTTQSGRSSENETRLKSLLRQERSENPVIWASIVLAREILLGRAITSAKLEKLLPSDKFDGSKRNYAIERAKRIAEKTKLTQKEYLDNLDKAVQKTESDIFWQEEFIENAYRAFSKGGEEYGFAKQKLLQYLKDMRNKELANVKGYKTDDFDFNLIEAILEAQEAEPERKKPSTSTEEEETDVSDGEFDGDKELSGKKTQLPPSPIRDVISNIRKEVAKRARNADSDTKTLNEQYRKTLVNILSDAAKELTYGKEREAIIAKINELSSKGYAVITIKGGERAGQKIDNYTLRAEHIALRIFNRGVRDTKNELWEKFEKAVKNIKEPKRIERDDKRKMTGEAEERAAFIKRIASLPTSSENKKVKTVESEIEKAMTAINRADSEVANHYHSHLIDAVERLEDLQRFGALKDKTRAEMAEAVEWIEKYLDTERKKQLKKVEDLQAEAYTRRKIFLDAINEISRNAAFDSKMRKSLRTLFNSASTFKDLLLGLGRASTGKNREKFLRLVNEMADEAYAATTRKENEVFRLQEEFASAVSKIYGMPEQAAFKHILGRNEALQKFSTQGEPMSVQIALQRLSMAEQENYRNNTVLHCLKGNKEIKTLEDKIYNLNLIEEKSAEDEAQISRLESELKAVKEQAVAEYVENLKSSLSPKDLELLEWFRNFYRRERESLSDANEAITGLGIPEVDPLYTPVKMLNEGGTNEKIQVVAIVPKSLTPRVANSRDMDESVGIVDIWSSRVAENAHYKAFSQLNIEWRGIFAHADFHKAVKSKLGDNVLTQVLDHFNDIMSVKLMDGLKIDSIDKLNGLYAVAALGYNLGSGLRQMTGASAFANFIGIKDTLKYAKDCLSKEGRTAAIEILNSETAKRRMNRGNNQALVEALNNFEDNKFWAWYKRHAMLFNRWGDILPIMTIGQGLYRSKTAEYAKSMPLDKAKEKAMAEMWAIAEVSQQSPSVMNLSTWQRRGGSFGKAAGLFISSPQLMLSREIEAFNRFNEIRKKYKENPVDATIREDYLEARNTLAKTVFINHIFVQGGYMLATVIWKKILGDDWDDDDWYAILGETLAGPLGGLIVFGRFVSAFYSNYSVSAMPIEGFGRTIMASVDFFQDLISLDGEEILKDLDRIADSLFSPWRDISRAYGNYTE